MTQKTYKVSGMHCASCATMIELDLEDEGITAKCNYAQQVLKVSFDDTKIEEDKIKKVVEQSGYTLI